jgi:SAM-dependent methyltransferase
VAISVARDLMLTSFESAPPTEPVLDMEKRMHAHRLGAMLVRCERGLLRSVVTRRMLDELREDGVDLEPRVVADVARQVTPVAPDTPLAAALESLHGQQVARLPVAENDRDLGVITRGDLRMYQEVETALGPKAADLIVEVSSNDEMFEGSVAGYLANGVAALNGVKRAQAAAGRDTFESILDFGCGHGRVLRILKAVYPQARLAACDINEDGVRFCARTFGAEPFLSDTDPARIELAGTFDLVWCASVLTHLREDRWPPLLRLFESVAAPRGVVAFTVLGAGAAERLRGGTLFGAPREKERADAILAGYDRTGFGYSDYQGQDGYGLSLSTPEWVASVVNDVPGLRLLRHDEGALEEVQDIVACVAA